jgi:hemerythrin-like domain-containing protein
LQRSSQLAVLSREHHVALEIALRLQRADEAHTETVRQATLDFWSSECIEHFRLEEEVLLPALAKHAGADDPDIQRILAEHADLRRRIAELDSAPDTTAGALNELGKLLSDHVRYEERTVFGRIEATLATHELDAIASHLHAAGNEHRPPRA